MSITCLPIKICKTKATYENLYSKPNIDSTFSSSMGRIGAIFDFCYPLYQIVDEELSHLINWSNTEKFNNILFDTIRYMKGALQIKDLDNMSIIEIFDFMIKTQTLMEENHKKE